MSVILKNTQPLYKEATRLSPKTLNVYLFLWQSACMDKQGLTEWTIKGIADQTNSQRKTVSNAIAQLIDDGLISVAGYKPSDYGTKHTVFRVTHPSDLEAVRYAVSVIGKPSEAWRAQMKPKSNLYEPYSISDDGCNFDDPDWSDFSLDNVDDIAMKQKYRLHTLEYFYHVINCRKRGVRF